MLPVGPLAVLLATAGGSPNGVTLPSYFASSMVLQHSKPAAVWGLAAPGAKVGVQIDNTPAATATATSTGRWEVELPGRPPSLTSAVITIVAVPGGTLELNDVVWGEVFVCSGQVRCKSTACVQPACTHTPSR